MKLKPLHDWAVIVASKAEDKTAGGIYIPDSAKEKPEEGIVEAIGPGAYEEKKWSKKKVEEKERKFIPTVVKPGDRVLYERYAGQNYKIEGDERILVRERDILGYVLRNPAKEQEPKADKSLGDLVRALLPSASAPKKPPAVKAKKTAVKKAKKAATAVKKSSSAKAKTKKTGAKKNKPMPGAKKKAAKKKPVKKKALKKK